MTEQRDFKNEEVEWKVDGISVHGTITRPPDDGLHPAVIFIAGSGPTDRDWCSPLLPGKNGSGRLLAEALAGQGFLTLRYDKRGAGPHVQENLPKLIGRIGMQSHVDELLGAVETLVAGKYANSDNIFVLTNSEGAVHAINYQLQAKAKFRGMALTGAPGRSISRVARMQIKNQVAPLPNAENIMKCYDEAIAIFMAGNPVVPDQSLPEGIKQLLRSLTFPGNLPFSRELWNYDLSEFIPKVKEPILILIGKKDIQVDWQADGNALEAATAKEGAVSFAYPENANHVLKHEGKPREKLIAREVGLLYNAEGQKLDQEAANLISSWLTERANGR
jgi:hypothetical protein